MEAKLVCVPSLSELKSSDCVWPVAVVCCKAYILPSRETFDQGYWVYGHRRLGPPETPPPPLVSLVSPLPSVLTFHNPFWLVSTFVPVPLLLTSSRRVVLLIERIAVIAMFWLVKIFCCAPPVAGRKLIVLGPLCEPIPGPLLLGAVVHWLVYNVVPSKLLSEFQQKLVIPVTLDASKTFRRLLGFWFAPRLVSRRYRA
jgi:hypothetical protein